MDSPYRSSALRFPYSFAGVPAKVPRIGEIALLTKVSVHNADG